MTLRLNIIVLLALGSSAAKCELFDPPRFFIPNFKIDWVGAVQYCHRLGMQLATVDSQSKNDAIVELILDSCVSNQNETKVWIGANDISEEGEFVWHNTGVAVNYTNWSPGNPSNFEEDEHCVEIGSYYEWAWNDNRCSAQFIFVCEF